MNNKLSLIVNFTGAGNLSNSIKNIIGLGNKGSKSLRALNGEAKKLTREIADYDRRISRTSGSANALWDQQKRKMQELEEVQKRILRQERLIGIEADRRVMAQRGQNLKDKGRDNVVGGATMAAPIILAVKAAADFSSGMVDIQQKADLSDAATRRMADNIVTAAAAAKQMPEAMRAGVDVLSGFGIDPRLATRMIAPIGRLGTAFKVEIADGAAAAYANLNNLKVPVGQTARALDVMAAAGNAGAFEVKDMARHFPGLTAQMQALGQKGVPAVADLSAALQIARRGAGDADEAANNVQNLLTKINAPGTVKAFKKNFGIDLPAALKAAYAKGKTPLEAIAELSKKATGGDMTKLGYLFEDMQAQSALRSMILNMDDFQKMRAQIAASSGTVDRAFNQRVAADATVKWRAMMGTLSATAIIMGDKLLPVIGDVMNSVSAAGLAVANWAQANPGLAAGIMKTVSAFAAMRIGVGILQFAIGGLLGPAAHVISFFRKVEGVSRFGTMVAGTANILKKAAPVFTMLRMAALFLARGVMQAGAMMLANPMVLAITAIVLAIGGAAYLIYTHWDRIKAAFWGGVAAVKGMLTGFPAWMKNIGSMMMSGLLSAINPLALGSRLIAMAKNGITAFKNYLGIKSPSRVFMALGGHVAGGLERGIDGNRSGPARAAGRMAAGVLAAGSLAMAPAAAAGRGDDSAFRMAAGSMAPSAARTTGADRAGGDTYHISLQIQQLPGEDAEALARRVMDKIDQLKARKSRSSYEDDR